MWTNPNPGLDRKHSITEEELKAWCKENMTYYKAPGFVEFKEELPKTLLGKVMHRNLMEADPIYKAYHGKDTIS